MYKNLIYSKTGKRATITINRPEVYNALNFDLIDEIKLAIDTASEDEEVRVVILTGSGEKAFCSGADLKAGFGTEMKPLGETLKAHYNPMINAIRNIKKPVLCRLNGVAAGAGMSLALACDLIIAKEDTYMSELFVGIGLMPDAGSMYFLPRIVGMQRAFEIFSTGRNIPMAEAKDLGIVSKVVNEADLDKTIEEQCIYYENAPTMAIGLMKAVLNKSFNSDLQQVLAMEEEGQTACGFSDDFMEGVMAFMGKRKPVFKGK